MKNLGAALLILLGLTCAASAQRVQSPGVAAIACAYNASPPTLTSGWFGYAQCDSAGKLIVISSGGGGGGAVTIADGADVAEGSTTDAAATSGSTGTVSAKLRLMTTQLTTLNTSLGTINTTLGSPFQAGGSIGNTAFTANAGTNLNTSLLALEGGGNLASVVTQLGAVTASPTANTIADRLKTINTTLGTPFQASGSIANTAFGVTPVTSGGLSVYNVQPTASDNHVVIKAGAGQVYKVEAFNNSATVNYVRFYNATTGFNGCNSATNLVWQGIIPASTSGAGLASSWELGMAFATGISICVTSGYATNDTTNATASALIVNVGYK